MNTFRTMAATLSFSILMSLSACGGGGGGASPAPPPPPPPTGGIGRNGVAVGQITDFGSIFVNGVEYSTGSTSFTVNDDTAASQTDLKVGDVVTVQGTIDDNGTTGTATSVLFEDMVTGPVDSIDLPGNSLQVLGQTVFVTLDTVFDNTFSPAALDGVSLGQVVEVTGQFTDTGDIVATGIEPKPAAPQFEVHGSVSLLDSTNMRFNLSNLVVDFSSATLSNYPAGQSVAEGDFVEAKGRTLNAAGELTADIIELESLLPGTADGDRVEIEGYITRFASLTDFDVAGLPVTTTTATVFTGGDAARLALNVKVEVEGDVDANGLLTAETVDIRRAKVIRATADVDSVDVANNSVVILGITMSVDALTRIRDKSSANVSPLNLSDILMGDNIQVRGDEFPAASGTVLAAIFERNDADPRAILQGFVETVSDPSYTVLGVTINTDPVTTTFRDENDLQITAAEFFARLAAEPNALVKARGAEVTDSITADKVQFEVEF